MLRRLLHAVPVAFVMALVAVDSGVAHAAEPAVVDRAAVRFVTPETGGVSRPRFFTARQVAFFMRIEAANEQVDLEPGEYPERQVRAAVDRLVARAMLASLSIQAGSEPQELPRLVADARSELTGRLGGPAALEALQKREGIEDSELDIFLFEQVRAMRYVDRVLQPVVSVTEDALRESYRSALHPFRSMKFEDARPRLRLWVATERFRAAELEFLQSARSRIKIVAIPDERSR